MALSLILRSTARTPVLPKMLPSNPWNVNATKPRDFSQFTNNANKTSLVAMASQNKLPFVLTKRSMSGDHGKVWLMERVVSFSLLLIVPLTFLTPNVVLDDVFAIVSVLHVHWGFEAICLDYIRPIIFGCVIPKVALGLLYLVSVLTLGGLIYYNHNSLGIGKTVRRIWELKPNKEECENL